MANKITVNKSTNSIEGNKALDVIQGTYLKVISHSHNDAVGDVLIRTSSQNFPFVNIERGVLWGPNIENYTFEIINGYITIETINL